MGTEEFTWGDLLIIIQQAPRSSAFIRAKFPDEAEWGLPEQLMASVADNTAVANWQRADGKKSDYPKPIPRPGVSGDVDGYTDHTADILTWEEAEDFLGWSPDTLKQDRFKALLEADESQTNNE